MRGLFRGPLMNQAADTGGGAAPAVAPVAPAPAAAPAPASAAPAPAPTAAPGGDPAAAPQAAAEPSWDAMLATFSAMMDGPAQGTAADPAAAPQAQQAPAPTQPGAQATPADQAQPAAAADPNAPPAEPPKFKPYKPVDEIRPGSSKEAFLVREANRNAATQAQQIEAYYQQQNAQLQAQLQQEAGVRQRFADLTAQGKHDEALKLVGIGGVEEFQRDVLRAKGALPPRDPAVEAMKAELAQFKRQQEEVRAQQQRMAAEAQAMREYNDMVTAAKTEMKKATDYEHMPQIADLPGAAEMLVDHYRANREASIDDHLSFVYHRFRGIFDSLAPIFGGQTATPAANPALQSAQAVQPVSPPAQPGVPAAKPATTLPQVAAADSTAQRTYANDDEAWEATLQEALRI